MNALRKGDICLWRIPSRRRCFRPVVVVHVPPPAHAGGPQRGQEEFGRVLARFPVCWEVPAGVRGSSGSNGRTEAEWMEAEGLVPVGAAGVLSCAHRKEQEIG